MASILKFPKRVTAHQIKPKSSQRPNPARAIADRDYRRKQNAANAASVAGSPPPSAPSITTTTSRQQCPNKSCKNPNVVDGICQTCGRVTDESNIVSDVQFGEAANGAAIVQGTWLGEGQAGPRPSGGLAYRRVAGGNTGESRERSLREARQMMEGFAHQLNVSNVVVSNGVQIYRTAAAINFIQGRGIQKVVAVCLYAACRKETPCKVMLIDLADLIKTDVFELGRIFKALIKKNVAARDRIQPVFAEDLIFRFAVKLEFDRMTNKIAETAVRLVQRMDRDWMVMGRKPAGICGCALIIAARMYNFRRTPMEVAYIAKVTMFTLTQRLDEFKNLKSADMSVEEFLGSDFLTGEHDPPSFYKKSEEWQAKEEEKKKKRKTKRKRATEDDGEADRQASPGPSGSTAQATQAPGVVDADGFVVPPLPPKPAANIPLEDQSALEDAAHGIGLQLETLAEKYGDAGASSDTGSPEGSNTEIKKRRSSSSSSTRDPQKDKEQHEWLTAEWEVDEREIEAEIIEKLNDPLTPAYAKALADAKQRAEIISLEAEQKARNVTLTRPPIYQSKVSEQEEVGEDEFAGDPEVENCLLSEEEQKVKEQIWLNENQDWLRAKQEKEYRAKMAPPKKTRRRLKKPRMGEGQSSPASTAGEASEEALRRRALSRRIDYTAIRKMVDSYAPKRPGSTLGSEVTSRQTSRAGSPTDLESQDPGQSENSEAEDDEGGNDGEGGAGFEDDGEPEEEINPFENDDNGVGEEDD